MNREELKNGYYWVMPQRGYYKDKWVIATYENGMFWIHGTGEAFMPDSLTINYNKIPMTDPLPPAEGAEEYLKLPQNDGKLKYCPAHFLPILIRLMEGFATLHAQRLADKMVSESKKPKGKCEMCGNPNVTSSFYCPNCSWHFNPIP